MNIEFEEITIENFCTIEHVKLKLNTPGLILITGVNKDAPKADSNGAGKSLLLDAICWCLWGETVRGLTTDDVVNRWKDKDCCVSLRVKDGANTYVVIRHRKDTRVDKPNDLRLFINGVEKGKKMKNLQEIINQIIGFDFDTFCVMMPGAGVKPATLTDVKIKELIEKLLQTEQLSAAYAAARERLKNLDLEIKQHSRDVTANKLQLDSLEKEVAQLHELSESFLARKAANIEAKQQRIDAISAEIQACEEQVKDIPSIERSISALRTEVSQIKTAMAPVETAAQKKIRELETSVRQLDRTFQLAEHDVASHNNRIAELKGLGAECPVCTHKITESHLADCEAVIQRRLQEAQAAAALAFASLQVAQNSLRDERKSLDDYKTLHKGNIDIKEMGIRTLEARLTTLGFQRTMKAKLEKDLAQVQTELTAVKAEEHNFQEILSGKAVKIAELEQAVIASQAKLAELEKEHQLCSFWCTGFSPAGLRSYMLDYVTPILNERADYYTKVLTAGEMKVIFTTKKTLKNGTEKEQFQILVEQAHGGNLYKATSVGEKSRADLVIAMALGDLAAFRTAKQLPWRFLDEPFEAIDDAGLEAVVHLLQDQKSRYKTVFVVTHKSAFKKLFLQRITMVKENHVSRLELS